MFAAQSPSTRISSSESPSAFLVTDEALVLPKAFNLEIQIHFPMGSTKYTEFTGDVLWSSDSCILGSHLILSDLIFNTEVLSVFKCNFKNDNGKPLCIKLRKCFDVIHNEMHRFLELIGDEPKQPVNGLNPSTLLPEFHCFVKICTGKETMGAIVMDLYDLCVVDVLFYHMGHTRKQTAYETLKRNFVANACTKNKSVIGTGDLDKPRGITINCSYNKVKSLNNALIQACLKLLQSLHSLGWVHGDSHLGNFLIDTNKMRVVLIDLERTYKSISPVQQYLDIQELIGHASTALVDDPYNGAWDMRDVQGITSKLHPGVRIFSSITHGLKEDLHGMKAFSMLPVCNCFSSEEQEERSMGCVYCKSKLNIETAKFYQTKKGFTSLLKSLEKCPIESIVVNVKKARAMTRLECKQTVEIFNKHSGLLSDKMRKISVRNLCLCTVDGEDQFELMCRLRVQRTLYLGAFVRNGCSFGSSLVKMLAEAGHTEDAASLKRMIVAPRLHVASSASSTETMDDNSSSFSGSTAVILEQCS